MHRCRWPPTWSASRPRRSSPAWSDGQVALLENVRYEPGEESKDDAERGALADRYAALADVFVSDGFGVVHRKQATVYDVAERLPSAAGGLVAGRGRGAAPADRGPASGRTSWCSAAPRSPTSWR